MARLDVGGTLGGVFGRCHRFTASRLAAGCLFKVTFEIRDTPSTTRSRTATFADLAGDTWPVQPDEVQDLAFGHMEAVTDGVGGLHEISGPAGSVSFQYTARKLDVATLQSALLVLEAVSKLLVSAEFGFSRRAIPGEQLGAVP